MSSLPIFTVTIFVSAFLLFLVQPLVGKLILPKLGGTPQVWNTCMVFFQSVLLLGYAYTHSVSTRLKLRQQLMVHGAILAIPVIMMFLFPIYGTVQGWTPPPGSNPMGDTLWLLFRIVGIPFFVVSTSAPLLQKWFAYSGHHTAKDPYFLYSASNLGSLLSLLCYPALIEPFTVLSSQSMIWFAGYALLAVCVLFCAYTIFTVAPPDEQIAAEAAAHAAQMPATTDALPPAPAPAPVAEASTAVKSGATPAARGIQRKKGIAAHGKPEDKPTTHAPTIDISYGANAPMTWGRRIRWVLLAAVPSSLMLGVTSYISTDLSPFPLVWIIPLSLYLLSFILVYLKWWTGTRLFKFGDGDGYTLHDAMIYVCQPLGILALGFIVLTRQFDPFFATTITMLGFFANALACHGELAKDRPSTHHLTEYFLCMSFGGMVGGFFNGILAPLLFQRGVYEFHIAIVIACFIRPTTVASGWFDEVLLNAFPGLRAWAKTQGDEMSKSLGRQPDGSTYMFSYFLDVALGLFILGLAWWLSYAQWDPQSYSSTIASKLVELIGGRSPSMRRFVINAWMYGIPMIFCFFFAGRPFRLGLAVTGLLLANLYFVGGSDDILEAKRTYFGVLRVMKDAERPKAPEEYQPGGEFFKKLPIDEKTREQFVPRLFNYTYLMHGTTYHGRNYTYTKEDEKAGYIKDATRLATTYYHRYGPVGVVFEQYNWLPGKQNTFYADARMPVSMIGQVAATIGGCSLPLPVLVEGWSEPPFATIGLGTGTMVSYARPYQHMTYYEIDDVIRNFSIPDDADAPKVEAINQDLPGPYRMGTRFTYLQNAIWRGVDLEVIMGDARLSLEPKQEEFNTAGPDVKGGKEGGKNNSYLYHADFSKFTEKAPKDARYYMGAKFEHTFTRPGKATGRDKYYKAIVVDAFSSDAIPVHLITRQAIEIYLSKMTDDGVLLVHTSNRHMDLVVPVARIALDLSKKAKAQAEKDFDDPEKFSDADKKKIWERTNPKKEDKYDVEVAKAAYIKSQEVNCLVGKDNPPEKESFLGLFSSEYVMIYRGDGFKNWVDKLKSEREAIPGQPPANLSILNSVVTWYDPYTEHTRIKGGRPVNVPVNLNDPIWTDDYSFILGVLR
ncbi:MAG TPA: hypothetical protein VFE62_06110 [Gemmataceae bacterium]|nr:hypothetical protein [Gemmataceae bacterium]